MEKMTFSACLLKLEKDSGLSKTELGALMGVTDDSVRKWQADKGMPNLKYLLLLSENFITPDGRKINPAWLLTGEGDPYIYKGVETTENDNDMVVGQETPEYNATQPEKRRPVPLRRASDLLEIYNYGDPEMITAIQANLPTFLRTVKKDQQVTQQADKIRELEEKNIALEARISALETKLSENNPGKDPAEEPGEQKAA